MQAAFVIRHGPIKFFLDFEVIFHVLSLLDHEESTIFNRIRNQSTPFQKIFSPLNQIIFLWFYIWPQMLVACKELSFRNEKQRFP